MRRKLYLLSENTALSTPYAKQSGVTFRTSSRVPRKQIHCILTGRFFAWAHHQMMNSLRVRCLYISSKHPIILLESENIQWEEYNFHERIKSSFNNAVLKPHFYSSKLIELAWSIISHSKLAPSHCQLTLNSVIGPQGYYFWLSINTLWHKAVSVNWLKSSWNVKPLCAWLIHSSCWKQGSNDPRSTKKETTMQAGHKVEEPSEHEKHPLEICKPFPKIIHVSHQATGCLSSMFISPCLGNYSRLHVCKHTVALG